MARIRRATQEDLPAMMRLWREYFTESPSPAYELPKALEVQREIIESILAKEQPGLVLYAPEGGTVVMLGLGRVLQESGIYVTPGARGSGLGTALGAEVLEYAKTRGFSRICGAPYHTNSAFITLLERAGFEPFQIVMSLEL